MSEPQEPSTPDRVQTPTISTAPTGGETPPQASRWWHRSTLPDHLGRARTSTVVLAVLFVAVFALYLNVRPEVAGTGTSPAGGSSDVEAPANPLVPSEPAPAEPTEEPSGTSAPEETEPSGTPSSSPSGSSSARPTPDPTTSGTPAETAGPTGTTGGTTAGTTAPSTSVPTSEPAP